MSSCSAKLENRDVLNVQLLELNVRLCETRVACNRHALGAHMKIICEHIKV